MSRKAILLLTGLLIIALITGCTSSYQDCKMDCRNQYREDFCTDFSDIWDGCYPKENDQLNKHCLEICGSG